MIYVRDPRRPFRGILYARKAALCRHPVVYGVSMDIAVARLIHCSGRQCSRAPAITANARSVRALVLVLRDARRCAALRARTCPACLPHRANRHPFRPRLDNASLHRARSRRDFLYAPRKRDLVDYARRVRVSPDKAARQRSVTGLSAATYRARERISI